MSVRILVENPCGCKVLESHDSIYYQDCIVINYCSKHNASTDMYKALNNLIRTHDAKMSKSLIKLYIEMAEDAILKADGK